MLPWHRGIHIVGHPGDADAAPEGRGQRGSVRVPRVTKYHSGHYCLDVPHRPSA
jgi:hypothetical protein